MLIKVYPSCCGGDKVVAAVEEAVKQAGVEADIEVVKDLAAAAKAGIISTPAITVDGRSVVTGRLPKVRDLVTMLAEAASKST